MACLKPKFLLAVYLSLSLASPVVAREGENRRSCELPPLKSAVVRKVHKDGVLQLENGEMVRLIGIRTLKLIDNAQKPITLKLNKLAQQTIDIIRNSIEGKKVELYQQGRTHDRYDRLLAHVFTKKGVWLQGLLLQQGLARTYSYRDNHACVAQMLALEEMARQKRRGLWRSRLFQPQQAAQARQLLKKRYRFTLVEGVVRKIASVKSWVFLNFGDDWHDDFTIAIKRKYRRKILESGLDLERLTGRRVRVRGWIERWNGPMIKVTHKAQIEILDGE